MRALVPMEVAQASFQILCLSAASRRSHLLRTAPPSATHLTAADYDAVLEWALASIKVGDGAAATELSNPEEVHCDPTVYQILTYGETKALRQTHLPLPAVTPSKVRPISLATRLPWGSLQFLFERLPEQPMASALLEKLKTVAT